MNLTKLDDDTLLVILAAFSLSGSRAAQGTREAPDEMVAIAFRDAEAMLKQRDKTLEERIKIKRREKAEEMVAKMEENV